MVQDFTAGIDPLDPHKQGYITLQRNATGFSAESVPANTAQFKGGNDNGVVEIGVDWGSVTSITFEIMPWWSCFGTVGKFIKGTSYTLTPSDAPLRLNIDGFPFGLKFTAMAGTGLCTIAVVRVGRLLGGSN